MKTVMTTVSRNGIAAAYLGATMGGSSIAGRRDVAINGCGIERPLIQFGRTVSSGSTETVSAPMAALPNFAMLGALAAVDDLHKDMRLTDDEWPRDRLREAREGAMYDRDIE